MTGSRDWIIPLPLGYQHRGQTVIGLMPCHGFNCPEFILVRLDKNGIPYAPCDSVLTVRGCKRRYYLVRDDIPDQAIATVLSMAGDVAIMPIEYQGFLARAWNVTKEELINGRLTKTDQERSVEPATQPAKNLEKPAGISETPGSSEPEQSAISESEPEPTADAEDSPVAEGGESFTGDTEYDRAMGYTD